VSKNVSYEISEHFFLLFSVSTITLSQSRLVVDGDMEISGRIHTGESGNVRVGRGTLPNNLIRPGLIAIGDSVLFENGIGNLANEEGAHNIGIGFEALRRNTTGYQNIAIGSEALHRNTTGIFSIAIGYRALRSAREGGGNIAIGKEVLFSTTTGISNTAVGNFSLVANTTGFYNTAFGAGSLENNTVGYSNVSNGCTALQRNSSGNRNTAVGAQAMYFNTTGEKNTGIGSQALSANTTGEFNSAIGFSSFSMGKIYSNTTALGYDAEPGASNTVKLGNGFVTSIRGIVDYTATSDARFKTNVQEDVPGIAFIESLRPVTYHLDWQAMDNWRAEHLGERDSSDYAGKRDIEKIKFTGFLAQEVEVAADNMGYDFSGVDAPDTDQQAYGLRYGTFVVPLVKATQEQQTEIRGLKSEVRRLKSGSGSRKAEIDELRAENEALRNELDELRSMVEQLVGNQPTEEKPVILNQSPRLEQNEPNPTNGTTRIQ